MNAKMSLLELVQNILSSMDSDEVNSIGDTVEALQVAEVVKETYFGLMLSETSPSQGTLVQLEAVSNPDLPNYLKIPDEVKGIQTVSYDYRTDGVTDYQDLKYLAPQDFLKLSRNRSGSGGYVEVEDPSRVRLWIGTGDNPRYWTTFDNQYLVFDSFNIALDTTLQETKSMCWGEISPTFEMEDDFIPRLDVSLFPLLLAESKSSCFINFKQASNSKEEQKARRFKVKSQNDLWRANQRKPYENTVDYGRKSRR